MEGLGTRDDDLIRLTVSRCEIDLENIKTEYETLYGKKLVDEVKSETSGDYQKGLLTLINGNVNKERQGTYLKDTPKDEKGWSELIFLK